MERLPEDLLLRVLKKLAVQDLLSFLSAIGACKSFQRIVEDNPCIWREAFLAPVSGEQIQSLLTKSEDTALDAEVTLLGGYKRLALARARLGRLGLKLAGCTGFPFDLVKHSKDSMYKEKPDQPCSSLPVGSVRDVARYLIIFRLGGKLLGWQAFPTSHVHTKLCNLNHILRRSWEAGKSVTTINIRFNSGSSIKSERRGVPTETILETWASNSTGKDAGTRERRVMEESLQLEVFGFVADVTDRLGSKVSREGLPWSVRFQSIVKAGVEIFFPGCTSTVLVL